MQCAQTQSASLARRSADPTAICGAFAKWHTVRIGTPGQARTHLAVVSDPTSITIPTDLLPADGRFGCGPSKVRPEAVTALAASASSYLGTSHRQATVLFEVGALRNQI